MNPSAPRTPRLRLLITLALVLSVALGGYLVFYASTFHIVKTDPKLSAVSTGALFVRLSFSQEIKKGSVKLSLPDGLFDHTTVEGKAITLYLNQDLLPDISYQLTIQNVESVSGATITNKKVTVVTRQIPVSKLSKEQQSQLIKAQDTPTNTLAGLPFSDFDILLDRGLTTEHLTTLKQAIFSFSQVRKEYFSKLSLDQNSIRIAPYDPKSASPSSTTSFTFTANGTVYGGRVTSTDLLNAVVVITDAAGNTVYDSSRAKDF